MSKVTESFSALKVKNIWRFVNGKAVGNAGE